MESKCRVKAAVCADGEVEGKSKWVRARSRLQGVGEGAIVANGGNEE